MRRIALWLLSTISAVVLLFGYHTSTSTSLASRTPPAVISGSASTATGSAGAPATAGSGSSTAGSSPPANGRPANGPPASSPSPSSAPAASRTVTGTVAQTRWGPVQVRLTVAGGSITTVAVVQYPQGTDEDQQINSYALPILVQETTQSQNAHIDMVSGATVTSDGYLQSLQSALDQAGL